MRVKLPKTEYPFLRLVVVCPYPGEEFDLIVSSSDTEAIIELPEGTPEDEVEVMAIFCDADMNEPPDVWTQVLKRAPGNPYPGPVPGLDPRTRRLSKSVS
jgi:hypothetical protein